MGIFFAYPLEFVPHVDLTRYCGEGAPWHEIAALPLEMEAPTQTATAVRITETYTYAGELLRTHGIRVVTTTQGAATAEGVLDPDYMYVPSWPDVHASMPGAFVSKIKTSGSLPAESPCPAHYWIVMLDTEHYTYAVVSEPTRSRLRVLYRRETMPASVFSRIVRELQRVHCFSAHQLRHLHRVAAARSTLTA